MLSPSPQVPQTMLSRVLVPHTMLSPSNPSVFAVPQTMLLAHALALGIMMPPVMRWLPQMMWRLHVCWTGTMSPARAPE